MGRGALLGRALELVPSSVARQVRLDARTAAAEFEVARGGPVVTRRLDLLVGSASRGTAPGPQKQTLSVPLSSSRVGMFAAGPGGRLGVQAGKRDGQYGDGHVARRTAELGSWAWRWLAARLVLLR